MAVALAKRDNTAMAPCFLSLIPWSRAASHCRRVAASSWPLSWVWNGQTAGLCLSALFQ